VGEGGMQYEGREKDHMQSACNNFTIKNYITYVVKHICVAKCN